ncbi:undecaprenyl-diphosphate phosphatase [Ketobacter sp. MCCC 1A13808]|uniref:undecaprenyl-diphosphate phosphatase n=1 Tax=Ketobacter sp. MCCC 1A13808 TaxID=2602738 RepID=UPI000F2DBA17|nr:undecaprenyl-diphosphate phosphatase [Ketobacter sp. MCCC 1A13808]MVF12761.1 undecaprenyl-diphosphate phosphatase [Ketobacter sp. MCCC 1A13808]RLP54020.1 MAG: undecaprenyl-diphosphate phosphatase [Ketobacter sp.]
MDNVFQALVLAVIQGLTEFLPVSSSAHLILPSQILGWPDQGQAFDVAVHLGTLLAVVVYFYVDLKRMVVGSWDSVTSRKMNQDMHLALAVGIATVPAVIFGGLFSDFIEDHLRSSFVIACTTVFFGLLLWASDKAGKGELSVEKITWNFAFLIGCAQALALIPGTSRSGITITAALFLGFSRVASARFSMLLSIPIIVAAGSLETVKLAGGHSPVPWDIMALGVVASAVSAFLCIHVFMRLVESIGMLPFVIYRLALGAFLFAFVGLN